MKRYFAGRNMLVVLGVLMLVSCDKRNNPEMMGVWEQKGITGDMEVYVCYHEPEDYLYETSKRKYWDSKTCSDLGYTRKKQLQGNSYLISPDGEYVPGEDGAFYKGWLADGGNTNNGGSGGGGSTYDYTYTCPGGGGGTVPITEGPCEQKQKNYAKVFGCNQVDKMYQACKDYHGCSGQNTTICDAYK